MAPPATGQREAFTGSTEGHGVRGQEPLRLLGRLEPLHLPLSSSGGPVRALRLVVQVSAGSVSHLRHQLTVRHAVALQPVRDDAPWPEPQPRQQALEEAPGCSGVAPLLHQDVEHHAGLVHCAPEMVQHTIDPQEHLIEVPGVTRPGPTASELVGEVGAEPEVPLPDALARDDDAPLGQDQLHVAQAQAEAVAQPHRRADDLRRKAAAGVGRGARTSSDQHGPAASFRPASSNLPMPASVTPIASATT